MSGYLFGKNVIREMNGYFFEAGDGDFFFPRAEAGDGNGDFFFFLFEEAGEFFFSILINSSSVQLRLSTGDLLYSILINSSSV